MKPYLGRFTRHRGWALLLTPVFVLGCGDGGQGTAAPEVPESVLAQLRAAQSVGGVTPIVVAGNPSCTTLNGMDETFPSITSDFGFKVESDYNRTVPMDGTAAGTSLTGGAPADATNTLTLVSADGIVLDWSATLSMDAVIMKGGTDGNVYVYTPESFGDEGLVAPVNASGDPAAISHVEFCYDYELTAEKTANAEYTRTYTWEITKSVDPASHAGFLGSAFTSAYDVFVDRTVMDSDWSVSGTITVANPTPFTVTFEVADVIETTGTTAAAVSCPTYELSPGGSTTCTYDQPISDPGDGTNTATISVTDGPVQGATATAGFSFGEPTTTVGYPTINVTDYFDGDTSGEALGSASGDFTFEYDRDFLCPSDPAEYTDGVYTRSYPNYAEIDETEQQDDANVDLTCYALVVSKDATPYWERTYTWDITKDVDDDSHSGVPGEAFTSNYTVTVDQTVVDGPFRVSGTITIVNPSSETVSVGISDQVDGVPATLDCGGSLNLNPGSNTCGYSAELPAKTDGTNTVTVTLGTYEFAATADYAFGETPDKENGHSSVNITDTNSGAGPWTASDDAIFNYALEFTCSSVAADYANGAYTREYPNQATITETTQSDDASVTLTCTPQPIVAAKTAAGTYDETHTWEVSKSVDPLSQSGYPGDELDWTWTVGVTETSEDGNHDVSGTITVNNPNVFPVDVTVTDLVGTTPAVVSCPSSTVPAVGSLTCSYSADDVGSQLETNTATVTSNTPGIADASASAAVAWTKNVIQGTATLTDDRGPLSETLTAGSGAWTFSYGGSHTCSRSVADYGADGSYSSTLDNTARLTPSGGAEQTAAASTTYTCEAGFAEVLKTTDGLVNSSMTWSFALFAGPDGYGGTQVGNTASTSGDADGILDFGAPVPALRPDMTYTVCELSVPAGWATLWAINGTVLTPYNPNADDTPPEDLGNDCFDFGATTAYAISVGQTIRFAVDNSYPGGAPRTPGYWKNWNTCTTGNQSETAAKNGGPAEGWYILDDILNDPGITLGDHQVGVDCNDAVMILDQRDLSGRNQKRASDAAYTLAMHLMAAKLNFAAGAGQCQDAMDAVVAADALLASIGYDGTGQYLRPRDAEYGEALELAAILDRYNNGLLCGG